MTFEQLKEGDFLIKYTRKNVEKKEILELKKTEKTITLKTKTEQLIIRKKDFNKREKEYKGNMFFSCISYAILENEAEKDTIKDKREKLEEIKWNFFYETHKNKTAYIFLSLGDIFIESIKPMRIKNKWYIEKFGSIKGLREMYPKKLIYERSGSVDFLLILGKKSLFDFSFLPLLGRSEKFLNVEKTIFDDFKKPLLTKRRF
jgi:hypothetical protein